MEFSYRFVFTDKSHENWRWQCTLGSSEQYDLHSAIRSKPTPVYMVKLSKNKPGSPFQNYVPLSDAAIIRILQNDPLFPRSVNYRLFQVIQHGKEPCLSGQFDAPGPTKEAFTSEEAISLFEKKMVPQKWISRFAAIAVYHRDEV